MKHLVFTGSGLAALSLVTRLIDNGVADSHLITLIDKDRKENNDRTWCFWEKQEGYFENVVYRKWKQLDFF
ncbi:MAG: lycopene cyclase family protein [Chitinophagaceae bacterium]|nr:lycopene cyclase family protein [Chitinophagaceae bacterium]